MDQAWLKMETINADFKQDNELEKFRPNFSNRDVAPLN